MGRDTFEPRLFNARYDGGLKNRKPQVAKKAVSRGQPEIIQHDRQVENPSNSEMRMIHAMNIDGWLEPIKAA